MAFELYFESEKDFKVAMRSEERNAARDDAANFAPLFDGEVHHVMYEVEDIPIPR